ncbi:MAG: hypothetical protein IJ879_01105, partial [Muribaculaceae bacterium]|nr:hypothetical protein [Muribaculaceae bacterium]
MHIDLTLSKAGELTGTITRCVKGDMKEMMLSMLDDNEAADRMQFMNNALHDKDHANKIEGAAWQDKDCRSEWAVIAATMTDGHSVEQVENELFVELDPDNMLMTNPIDTTDRKNDYVLPFPCRQVREVALTLPVGYRCEQLPDDYDRHADVADLSCTFRQEGNTIIYSKVMSLHHPRVPLDRIMA